MACIGYGRTCACLAATLHFIRIRMQIPTNILRRRLVTSVFLSAGVRRARSAALKPDCQICKYLWHPAVGREAQRPGKVAPHMMWAKDPPACIQIDARVWENTRLCDHCNVTDESWKACSLIPFLELCEPHDPRICIARRYFRQRRRGNRKGQRSRNEKVAKLFKLTTHIIIVTQLVESKRWRRGWARGCARKLEGLEIAINDWRHSACD